MLRHGQSGLAAGPVHDRDEVEEAAPHRDVGIPSFIFISDGKLHDVNILDQLLPEPGAIYVMDRGYIDFDRLGRFHEAGSFFVIRAKANLKAERRYSHAVDRSTGLVCDQIVTLTGFYSHKGFPAPLRRIRFKDPETGKRLVFLSRGPRIIATDRQAPRIYPRMIPFCSRFDSVLFTPKISAIASSGNYSRSPT